jgi:carboxymethylenebutenolidase
MKRILISLTFFALMPAASFAGTEKQQPAHFESGGKKIVVETFVPPGNGKHPALLLLHAADGLGTPEAKMYRDLASDYAGRGYVIVLVHYFDRTGATKEDHDEYRELFVDFFTRQPTQKVIARTKELFAAWAETVRDAVAHARTLPRVDGERIGLVGFSLGGALAVATAVEHDLKLAALVECFGAVPFEIRVRPKTMAPTLIIHGDADRVVPVQQAYRLAGMLLARKLVPEMEIYEGVHHMFFKDGKQLQALSLLAAKARADAFLDTHLKPVPPSSAVKASGNR